MRDKKKQSSLRIIVFALIYMGKQSCNPISWNPHFVRFIFFCVSYPNISISCPSINISRLLPFAVQARPIQTQWSEPPAPLSTGYLSCPLWRERQRDKKSSRKWGNLENLHPDNHLLPSRPAYRSKPPSLCQGHLTKIKHLWHLVRFSSLL